MEEFPQNQNNFSSNEATFGNDYYTYPVRLRFKDNNGYDSLVNSTIYSLLIIPGITSVNLYFEIIDFYNQTISSLNGR